MEFHKAILYGRRDLRIDAEIFDRPLASNEIRVQTLTTALSTGTDLGNYLGDSKYVPGAPDYPRPVGYSNVGKVMETGGDGIGFRAGDIVFSTQPHRSGFIATERNLLVSVPKGLSSEEASLAYLMQLGLAALRQARYETGENVVVAGLGVIGLCTVALARAMGAKVVAVANSDIRAQAALRVGAERALLSDNPDISSLMRDTFRGAGADIVILTSNTWDSYFQSLDLVRRRGRVSILGFPGRGQAPPARNPLDPEPFYSKQLTLLGAGHSPSVECDDADLRFNLRRNLEYILDLMALRRVDVSSLITHRFPYVQMKDAYELALTHSKDLIAAVFDWQ